MKGIDYSGGVNMGIKQCAYCMKICRANEIDDSWSWSEEYVGEVQKRIRNPVFVICRSCASQKLGPIIAKLILKPKGETNRGD